MSLDPFVSVITSAGVGATLSGLVLWLGKDLISERLKQSIKAEYDEKLETHKAQLKARSDVELERLRSDLKIAAAEHEIRYSKLHEKRADVIEETYSTLVQAHWDLSSFTSPMDLVVEPNKKEKYETAMNSVADFDSYFNKHRIYLPEELCSEIDELVQEMRQKAIGFGVYVDYNDLEMPDHQFEKKYEARELAWEFFSKKVPKIKLALEAQLRGILGEPGS